MKLKVESGGEDSEKVVTGPVMRGGSPEQPKRLKTTLFILDLKN